MPTIDALTMRMERINALAEVLYDQLCDNQNAQILAEIIIETSAPPTTPAAV